MANENKLEEIIRASLENIRSMIDADTVIGAPIHTESGTTIIPVSKVSVGYASGGLDYDGKTTAANRPQNFGAGGGTGLSISPVGFLVVKKDANIEMINVGQPYPTDPVEQIAGIIERSPEIINRIKAVFKKKDSENHETEFTASAEEPEASHTDISE